MTFTSLILLDYQTVSTQHGDIRKYESSGLGNNVMVNHTQEYSYCLWNSHIPCRNRTKFQRPIVSHIYGQEFKKKHKMK